MNILNVRTKDNINMNHDNYNVTSKK